MTSKPEESSLSADASAWSTIAKKNSERKIKEPPAASSSLQQAAAAASAKKRNPQGRSKSFSVVQVVTPPQRSNSSTGSSNRRSSYTPQNSHQKLHNNNNKSNNKNNKNRKTPGRSQSYSVVQQQQQQKSSPNKKSSPHKKYKPRLLTEITLLQTTTDTATQKTIVRRFSADTLLSHRMQWTEAPTCWTPHDRCLWKSADRVAKIQQQQSLFYNFKPLAVNDETRWKPKSQQQSNNDKNDDEKLASIQAILNKLSWTNLDKLTLQFLQVLTGENTNKKNAAAAAAIPQDMVKSSMSLVVNKALSEPHFAELYARLSTKLAAFHKAFKKTVLVQCQQEFEAAGMGDENDNENNNDNAENKTAAETEQAAAVSRKKSIGLMKFIGELYVTKLIKSEIMISCLERLLDNSNGDEEKLECFCKLMTTIGKRLEEEHAEANQSHEHIWEEVYCLAGQKSSLKVVAPSTRIKFLLQALIELKENQWVQIRHQHEKAKTIAQIHKEVAREAKRGPITKTTSLRRSQSGGGGGSMTMQQQQQSKKKNNSNSSSGKPVQDEDGFVQVASIKPKRNAPLRRVKSADASPLSSLQRAAGNSTVSTTSSSLVQLSIQEEVLEPKECGDKTKTILKEYFVGGDRDEAVLSISELVHAIGSAGHVDRGAAVIEAGVLLVMEMKEVEVRKYLDVVSKCLDDNILDKASLAPGLNDPLEFLRDIEIDAPLASKLLAIIITDWLSKKVDDGATALSSMDFLLMAPEYFRTDGRPAAFCAQILKERGGGAVSDADVEIVSKLMNDEDKKAHASTRDFLESLTK